MSEGSLYVAAMAYKDEKLWEKLGRSDVFAVRFPDGEIGYCSVTDGRGLGLMTDRGLAALRKIEQIRTGEESGNPDGEGERLNTIPFRKASEPEGSGKADKSSLTAGSREEFDMNELRGMSARSYIYEEQEAVFCSFVEKNMLVRDESSGAGRFLDFLLKGRRSSLVPVFHSVRPMGYPEVLPGDEERRLELALLAAVEVSRTLEHFSPQEVGFSGGNCYADGVPLLTPQRGGWLWERYVPEKPGKPDYPAPRLENDVLAAKLCRGRRRGAMLCSWAALSELPLEKDGRKQVSQMLLAVDTDDMTLLPTHPVGGGPGAAEEALADFARLLQEHMPMSIYVWDDRTEAFLEPLCRQCGIRLARCSRLMDYDDTMDMTLLIVKTLAEKTRMLSGGRADQIVELIEENNSLSDLLMLARELNEKEGCTAGTDVPEHTP